MSKQSHTPGPWEVDIYGDVIANGEDIARIATDDDHADADARLIAAAPDLLEAAKNRVEDAEQSAFEDWMRRTRPSGCTEDVTDQWHESSAFSDFAEEWRKDRAAIAKATGEMP